MIADYDKWREIEREFRTLCQLHEIRATETPDGWIVRSRRPERFKALANIAAFHITGGIAAWNNWLDLLKEWLLAAAEVHGLSASQRWKFALRRREAPRKPAGLELGWAIESFRVAGRIAQYHQPVTFAIGNL
jgi:hypothetical protein